MPPAQRRLAIAFAVTTSLAACGQRRGFDQMDLRVLEVGEVRPDFVLKLPAHVGDITTWRTTFPGQVFAAVKTEAPCPRDLHTLAGVQVKKDVIELCFTATPRADSSGFACATDVYVKYEMMGVPADVEPKFAFVGTCLPGPSSQGVSP